VEQIRARLGDRFKLLTRSGTGAPSRQQTVLAVIQWSWDHLLEPEQDLLRRLAVFTGGWTLERAAAVCTETGDEFEVLDLLTRLVERSLVVVQHGLDHGTRYRFLESVWRFALQQLEQHAEHAQLRERHLSTYLALSEKAETAMSGPGLPAALKELSAEEENVLAAFAWCAHAESGAERGLRLAAAAHRFWSVKGHYVQGLRVQSEALARDTGRQPTPIRAKVLTRAAGFALIMGDYERARPHLEESLAACRAIGDEKGIARALAGLCVVDMYQSRFEEGLAIGEESLATYEKLGEKRGVAMALHNLATIEWALGRADMGRARFESALAMLRETSDPVTVAICLSGLASALVRLGEHAGAAGRLREALDIVTAMDAPRESVFVLEALAEWLFATGDAAGAARLIAAGATARRVLGAPLMPHESSEVAALLERVTATLGPDERVLQDAAGASLSLADALAEAKVLVNRVR
jgi:non-specific serine/threonine protein kinase